MGAGGAVAQVRGSTVVARLYLPRRAAVGDRERQSASN